MANELKGTFIYYKTPKGNFNFRLKAPNKETIAVCEGAYADLKSCKAGIDSVRRFCGIESIEDLTLVKPGPEVKFPKYQIYKDKQKQLYDPAQMLEFEKVVLLRVVDSHWTDHIDVMDQFRQSVGLRGYGQLNPLVEYQTAGYHMFEQMIADIEYETTRLFMKSQIRQNVTR